jgi:hypothetical protein
MGSRFANTETKPKPLETLISRAQPLARSERFELPTLGFEVRCSIQLSYERVPGLDYQTWPDRASSLRPVPKGPAQQISCTGTCGGPAG